MDGDEEKAPGELDGPGDDGDHDVEREDTVRAHAEEGKGLGEGGEDDVQERHPAPQENLQQDLKEPREREQGREQSADQLQPWEQRIDVVLFVAEVH